LQASGRPDWTAKLHVAELPCYAGLLYWATTKHGIEGAAAAWSFRVTVEAIVLFLLTRSLVKNASALRVLVTIIYASAILLLSFILNGLMTKAAVFALSLSAFLWVTWSWTFTSSQRLRVRSWLKHAPALAYLR
jgi:hypothetical protein